MEGPILSSGDLFTDAMQSAAPFKKHFLERRASELLGAEVVGSTAVNFSGPFVSFFLSFLSRLSSSQSTERASESSAVSDRRRHATRARDIACRATRGGPAIGLATTVSLNYDSFAMPLPRQYFLNPRLLFEGSKVVVAVTRSGIPPLFMPWGEPRYDTGAALRSARARLAGRDSHFRSSHMFCRKWCRC